MNTQYIDSYDFHSKNPFALIPWHMDFLEEIEHLTQAFSHKSHHSLHPIEKEISKHKNGNTHVTNKQNIILVFPHTRPKRYLENRYKKLAKESGKAHILPHIMTGTEFQKECLLHFERIKIPYQELSSLDRISYLHKAVLRVAKNLHKGSVLRRLLSTPSQTNQDETLFDNDVTCDFQDLEIPENQRQSLAKFFPWASSLDSLFEECFTQLVDIIDISYAKNEVNPFAAALLSQLRAIHKEYILLLQNKDARNADAPSSLYRASTPAFTAYRTAEYIKAYRKYHLAMEKQEPFSYAHDALNLGIETMNNKEQENFFNTFMPDIFRDKIIIFAGFVHLTKAEDILFHFFWEKGACVALHSDPQIYHETSSSQLQNSPQLQKNLSKTEYSVHYSCEHHVRWLESWGASCALLPATEPLTDSLKNVQNQNIHFYSAYDSHSQIQALKKDLLLTLQKNDKEEANHNNSNIKQASQSGSYNANLADDDIALLLPEPSLLMPLLHELPEKDVNISMGYPISRTLFGQCIELLLSIQENNITEKSAYIWKDILALLSHPYAHMLTPNIPNTFINEQEINPNNAWRSILYYLETSLRNGSYFVDIKEFINLHLGDYDGLEKNKDTQKANTDKNLLFHDLILNNDLNTFSTGFFHTTIQAFENIQSLQDMAKVIENFITFLIEHGSSLWQRFPLESESITICVERILPSLRDNALSHEFLPQEALFTILRNMIDAERIPFEADPLQGMQILGMLESRLLRFKNVFLLDMTENNLPGAPKNDSLLPDSLRSLLALPDTHTRELIMAHTFYRLIAGAENVWLYWQEGVQSSDIQTSKNLRSRFVEECLWQKEQKAHTLLHTNKNVVRTAECIPHTPSKKQKKNILITQKIKEHILEFLKQGLSPTALNTYIQCPANFFYTYLLRLGEMDAVNEGNDARLFGSWLHKIFYNTYINGTHDGIFYHDDENFALLMETFNTQLELPNVAEFTSDESFFMLKNAGKYHLENYFKAMPYTVKPIAFEQNYTCNFSLQYEGNTLQIPLKGICDRVDIRSCTPLADLENTEQYDKNTKKKRLDDKLFNDKQSPHYIIDYKTGKKENVNEKIWNANEFWEEITLGIERTFDKNIQDQSSKNTILLQDIAKAIPNIQLPFYLYLYAQNFPSVLCNASWVFLGEKEPEVSLVTISSQIAKGDTCVKGDNVQTAPQKSRKKTNTQNESDNKIQSEVQTEESQNAELEAWDLLKLIKEKRMPSLLTFVLSHLLHANTFEPSEGKACRYCPHKNYC